jgi:hypothetical protein
VVSPVIEYLFDAVITVIILVFVDVYVLGNQTLFNTTAGAPGASIITPALAIFNAVIIIVALLIAVFVIPKAVTSAGSK